MDLDYPIYQRTQLGDSVDKASMRMLKETFQDAEDKNVVASPLGVLTLLSMYSTGTEGMSKQEIMKLLVSEDSKELEQSYANLTVKFGLMDPSYLIFANKMYVSNQYTLDENFSDVINRAFKSEVERVDFEKTKETVASINKWAHDKTKGHISCPVSENAIDKSAAVALFNVIFFQGHWHVPFDAKKTENKTFYVNKKTTIKKPMMKLLDTLFYHEAKEIGARMVELPYKEKGFRMVVVLPDKIDGLPTVLEKVAKRGILQDVFSLQPSRQEIALQIPKFEIENSLNLNKILPKVGVSRVFTDGASSVVQERPVQVSSVFQQAFVKIDEEGATAGAFTGFVCVLQSTNYKPPPPLKFKVDRPFLFIILHEDIVLFTGTYTH